MDITITIPDQVWQEDKDYPRYFEAIQFMVNRMAMSHFKYGIMGEKCQMPGLDDMLGGRKRLCMYDGIGPEPENKPIDTGNTENLLDAANFFILRTSLSKALQGSLPRSEFERITRFGISRVKKDARQKSPLPPAPLSPPCYEIERGDEVVPPLSLRLGRTG